MNPTERDRPSWDVYGISLAYAARLRSADPHYQVGACALRKDHSLAATGYNGAPPGVEIDWSDREARRPFVDHAEYNCLKYTIPGEVFYLYVTCLPCQNCYENLRLHGVRQVFYTENPKNDDFALDICGKHDIVITQLRFDPYEYFTTHFKPALLHGSAYSQNRDRPTGVAL